ncbi:MAG: alpha-amylase family protein [Armatimonadota bacterium]
MYKHTLRFRQIHLDFHTSPHIPNVGVDFDKKQWRQTLLDAKVNSITCFSKCHHGFSYHPTKVGTMHPHLKFDLLKAQYEACKEVDINVPIYISAGVDDVEAEKHPEWREISINGQYQGWNTQVDKPGFKTMCFNTPYLDFLCKQIEEVVTLYPHCDGIFLDIIFQGECCCTYCVKYMQEHGLDIEKQEDRRKCADMALLKYYEKSTAACKITNKDMPVFHNSGHIPKGRQDLLKFFSHLELESLPTGGWGYDHFPMSAKYVQNLDVDFMGMTGKFHTMWGEFGGYKHPNALKYESALALANGAKISVGDQLHPSGKIDTSTYGIIKAAYDEVEKKEPWCDDVKSIADIAVLSSEAEARYSDLSNINRNQDIGVGRVLLESHFLFDLLDRDMSFDGYKLLILPDVIKIDDQLKKKIDKYLLTGGKLLLTGKSGLSMDEKEFVFDIGGVYEGESEHQPDYLLPIPELAPDFVHHPMVMYMKSQKVRATDGRVLADIEKPFFNRKWNHYCSHQHAPNAGKTEYAGILQKDNITYMAHPIFSIYGALGAVIYKDVAKKVINNILGDNKTLKTNLPSTARITLMNQEKEKRYVLHLLYANTISRGSEQVLSPEGYVYNSHKVEVIEELLPLYNTIIQLKIKQNISKITLEPEGKEIDFIKDGDYISIKIDQFTCHQMVVLHY